LAGRPLDGEFLVIDASRRRWLASRRRLPLRSQGHYPLRGRMTHLPTIIAQGAGREAADVVIKNVHLLDLVTGALEATDIAICGDRIVGTHGAYRGIREIDGRGKVAVPGFIDTHFHCESSLLTPDNYDRSVLPHGVTTSIWDPHEIANVLGLEGIGYALDCAEATLMDIRVMLSSCVPSSALETAGATLEIEDLLPLLARRKALGLAEFMNFPGVINADPKVVAKLDAFQEGHIDGHAPLLSGLALNAYLAARIRTDHECTSAPEALEKLKKGMAVLIREGSVTKDLAALAPLISADTSTFLAFCTDDRNPIEVHEEGHLDYSIREAIRLGAPIHHAYRIASLSAARIFGLRDRGFIGPGWRADIVLLDDLAGCRVADVIVGGRMVDEAAFAARPKVAPVGLASVKARRVTAEDFRVLSNHGPSTPVIGVAPRRVITDHVQLDLPMRGSEKLIDLDQDVVKVAVIERHGKNGNIARGFTTGFGMKRGAIASSVGHDAHNICVVGADDADMAVAVNRLSEIQGGYVVAEGGKVIAELPLPVAGLMSLAPADDVRKPLVALKAAAMALGCVNDEPFQQVAFLPLPVIPHLKITDVGVVDVFKQQVLEV
jgi:adenine deaminase